MANITLNARDIVAFANANFLIGDARKAAKRAVWADIRREYGIADDVKLGVELRNDHPQFARLYVKDSEPRSYDVPVTRIPVPGNPASQVNPPATNGQFLVADSGSTSAGWRMVSKRDLLDLLRDADEDGAVDEVDTLPPGFPQNLGLGEDAVVMDRQGNVYFRAG